MILLAIDTSCDETSVAVVNSTTILSNAISSQIRYHKKYGGVVPFLAQRLHKERIHSVTELALSRAQVTWDDIQAIAVTQGPGLAPALEVGISYAKSLSNEKEKPLYAVNHMAGHIASCFAQVGNKKNTIALPSLALLVSGGHTEMVYMPKFGHYTIIGQTLDDAIGEAYDKVAKMLGLGYPGGKVVANLAQSGNVNTYTLPIPMIKSKDLNFSYSGLKNAVRLLIEEVKSSSDDGILSSQQMADICATFEYVAQESILRKLEKAIVHYPDTKSLLLAGGVASNSVLRKKVRKLCSEFDLPVFFPINQKLCTDNGAMIGVAAYLGIQEGQLPVSAEELDRKPSLVLG